MIAIVLEENQKSRRVLGMMLSSLGYTSVLQASGPEELTYLAEDLGPQANLIVVARTLTGGLDFPLIRQLFSSSRLELTPLIVISSFWFPLPKNLVRNRQTRIDDLLAKPFGEQQLRQSIVRANRTRMSRRDTLLILGTQDALAIETAILENRDWTHWRTPLFTENAKSMEEMVDLLGNRLGGILLDPAMCGQNELDFLVRFKKTEIGKATQIVAVTQESEHFRQLREVCSTFVSRPATGQNPSWKALLRKFSIRVLHEFESKERILQIKTALRHQDLKAAEKLIKIASEGDLDHWGFQELLGETDFRIGRFERAIFHFKEALKTNPGLPRCYIRLAKLLTGEDRMRIIAQAVAFCPAHPQVQAAVTLREGKK